MEKIRNVLVTGGCGFIGSHFIRLLLRETNLGVVNIDKLTYAGSPVSLEDVQGDARYQFIRGDIADKSFWADVKGEWDAVIHFAAESHVDRSIVDADEFINTNIVGTYNLLEWARRNKMKRFVYISTDEVYGSLGQEQYSRETDVLEPNSPYSASKASGDHLVRSYHVTYKLPAVITRCTNNYGPYQYPEKFIPVMILRALRNEPLPIYGDGLYVRSWLHVEDHCRAILAVLNGGRDGEIYNIGPIDEWKNIDVAQMILRYLERPKSLLSYVTDRPGHDRRYALDSGKIRRELNWLPKMDFQEGLRETVEWYVKNMAWVETMLARVDRSLT